jgi:hypothetical protein
MADGITISRGLLGVAQVGDGPTPEQIAIVQSLLRGYFGLDADAAELAPMSATELAAELGAEDHKRVVDLLVVVEFCRHADGEAQAQRAEEYARALGVDEPFLIVARDALTEGHERVMADWSPFREVSSEEPGLPGTDAELAARLRSLRDCPAGSLGRAYFDFLDGQGIAFPGEEGGGDSSLVAHDFSHVLAGYHSDAPSELALQAMLTSATGFEHHFSGLIASLALYESGKFDILDITGKVGALARPGASDELAEAFRRGGECACDFSAIDHLARADEPLEVVRTDCGIPPRAAAA